MKKVLSIVSILLIVLGLSACKPEDEILFQVLGDEVSHHVTNIPYVEKGFIAKDGIKDISEYVTIEGSVDATQSGNYTVTYTLDYEDNQQVLTRYVYFREGGCAAVHETNLTECLLQWSQYLDTLVSIKLYYEDDKYHDDVEAIYNNIEDILNDYHKLSNKYDGFTDVVNVKVINEDPTTTHVIDQKLFDLISFSLNHQDEVDNLFNIALGPVLSLWHDSRENCSDYNASTVCELPDTVLLDQANNYTDPSKIILDEDNVTITMEENMSIDLGGVSKGYISGIIINYLDNLDLYGYLVNNGTSNISIGGTHPTRESGKFKIAITDPTGEKNYYALVNLSGGDQLVTSGDYQKFFEFEGTMYHHIISPVTLMPERNSRSVSIITSDPGLADLYSTAIFVMTIEEGIEFVNSIDGLEGIWYDLDGTIHFSENFEEMYLDSLN